MYNGILLSRRKGCDNAIHSNMDEPRGYCVKWSMLLRERQVSYDITYMQHLKKIMQKKKKRNKALKA